MKKIIIGILVTFLSVPAFARTISGTVVDENNLPLQAATIILDGSNNTIYDTTDSQGQFTLTNVPESTVTITVQYLGYKTANTTIKQNQNSTSIKLSPDTQKLDAAVTIKELSKEDVCTEKKLKELNASSGDIYRKLNSGVICIPTVCIDGYELKGTGANTRCEDLAGTPCQPDIGHAKKSTYERTSDGKLICPLKDCENGYRPNDKYTQCIQSDGDCTKDQLNQMKVQHPNATKGQFDSASQRCYPTACDSPRYSLTGTRPDTKCEDNVGKPCKPEDMNADKTEYAMSGNKLICQIKSCKTGYNPSNNGLSCIPEPKILQDGDPCDPKIPHATAGEIRNGNCYPTKCEGPRYVLNDAGDDCKDMLKEPCSVNDTNAKKTKYEIRNNQLVCIIQTCTKGYIPDDSETTCIQSDGDCTPDSKKYPNATAGELIKGECYPTACANGYELKGTGAKNKKCELITCEGPRYVLNATGDGCKDMLKEPCSVNDENAKKTKYEIRNNQLVCIIQTCTKGYIPDDSETTCIKSDGDCTPDSKKYPNATAGELIKGECYPTACANGYELKGTGARNKKCEPIEKSTDTTPVLSKEDSQKKIDELQENYDKVKENEQSWANKGITAASMGATGIGASMALSALSEQNADAAAERDMQAYLATFRCTYGNNQVRGGEKDVFLPGGNVLLPLYTEYVNLADSLKERKNALGMMPGIESEVIINKSTAGLYDDEFMGKNNGTFISLADAFLNPTGTSAQDWAAQQAKTAETLKAGLITAGAGIATGIIGNAIVNHDAYKDRSDEIENDFAFKALAELEENIKELESTSNNSTQTQAYIPATFDSELNFTDNIANQFQMINASGNNSTINCDYGNTAIIDQKCQCLPTFIPVTSDDITNGCKCPANKTQNKEGVCMTTQQESETIYLPADAMFDFNQAVVKPDAVQEITKFTTEIANKMDREFIILITGYTDTIGTEQANQKLSERRAKAVQKIIEDNFNTNPPSVTYTVISVGVGESQCKTQHADNRNVSECRKVSISLIVDYTESEK